jgi:Domain of unknown function (DUF929)
MGKASRAKRDIGRREKIAAQREAERRQELRNRLLIAGSAIAVVVIIVVVFVVVKANNHNKTTASSGPTATAPSAAALSSLVSQVTSVPVSATDAVGGGGSQVISKPMAVTGSAAPLTANGKPEMLYVGAEYCPYCAAERWSMIVALSRFGTFSGLKPTHSAAKNGAGTAEPYPNTATWTFHGSSFTSQYLTFTPVEVQTNIPDTTNGGYTTLETMTSAQNAVFSKYDAPPFVPSGNNGSFPFVDFGNKYIIAGASYNPQVLANMTWSQIAAALSKPSSPVAMGINGTANYMTAAICKLTNNQPASACTSTVQQLQSKLVAP